ncbi:hypothetical protein IEO70_06740 [Bacillus sp. AGMB 02131]|uniref:Uncharacterized protein n=1 Tax=Peribacillus faecalis TaxID=2772559 RepID=A0A927CYI5_9BACI|nr:hypothetical protein [Peribacillus faecalis]MBD3108060.1 hypothetical protein [Peribacillus faecalis]
MKVTRLEGTEGNTFKGGAKIYNYKITEFEEKAPKCIEKPSILELIEKLKQIEENGHLSSFQLNSFLDYIQRGDSSEEKGA